MSFFHRCGKIRIERTCDVGIIECASPVCLAERSLHLRVCREITASPPVKTAERARKITVKREKIVLTPDPLSVRRIGDQNAAFFRAAEFAHICTFKFNMFGDACALGMKFRHGNCLFGDI